jgi:hypothetical protein
VTIILGFLTDPAPAADRREGLYIKIHNLVDRQATGLINELEQELETRGPGVGSKPAAVAIRTK